MGYFKQPSKTLDSPDANHITKISSVYLAVSQVSTNDTAEESSSEDFDWDGVKERILEDIDNLSNGNFEFESNFNERFVLGQFLGRGGFGFVMKSIEKETNKEVAVKFVTKVYLTPNDWIAGSDGINTLREIHFMSQCEHPNIISYIESIVEKNYILIVTELHGHSSNTPCQDLAQYIHSFGNAGIFDESLVCTIFSRVLAGVSSMH